MRNFTLIALTMLVSTTMAAPAPTYTLVVKLKPLDEMPASAFFDELNESQIADHLSAVGPSFRNFKLTSANAQFPIDRYYTARVRPESDPGDVLKELAKMGTVESVQPDYELTDPAFVRPADPQIARQWYLDQLRVPDAWTTTQGQGVFIADVESGFDTDHPDLKGQFDLDKTYDYDPKTDDVKKVNDNKRSHGTPVVGIIGAKANNDMFGVGIAYGAKLIGSQMANSSTAHNKEEVWTVNAAKAILGSVERGASVILIEKQIPSLLSSVERITVIYDAIKVAVAKGIPVVVPGGNFSRELKEEAQLEDSGSIMVGATTRKLGIASFSNYGARINVAAPGEDVYSVQEDGSETFEFGGTSSASAITAGIVGLVRAANPKLAPREIRDLLMRTGLKVESERDEMPFGLLRRGLRLTFQDASSKVIGTFLQAGPAVSEAASLFQRDSSSR